MLVKTFGCALYGINATTITVEVNIDQGINFYLVGLPDSAVKESHQRIEAALSNNGYKIPGKKIVINMAPADLRKQGSAYDLTIALGILGASGQVDPGELGKYIIMGELSLDGGLLPVTGALPMALEARKKGFKGLIVPAGNAREAAIVDKLEVLGAGNIREVIDHFNGKSAIRPVKIDIHKEFLITQDDHEPDFCDVKGQEAVKRALEIAAAGGHNVIMIGPPGAGKTMLAKRLPSILPAMTLQEALETTRIHSVAGKMKDNSSLVTRRPFRAPHHTISDAGLVGGGSFPQPGEISLAQHGVLFLDELPEFRRTVLEVMRQPMEERKVTIARARHSVVFPASFMLVAAMNPCPCGYYNHLDRDCVCPPGAVAKYLNKVSGPLMDRIDIHLEVAPAPYRELATMESYEKSRDIRERVLTARKIQQIRFRNEPGIHSNALMNASQRKQMCHIDHEGKLLLKNAMEKLGLSARAYDRIIKVARSIADLEGAPGIKTDHLAEAIHFRSLDRGKLGEIRSKWQKAYFRYQNSDCHIPNVHAVITGM